MEEEERVPVTRLLSRDTDTRPLFHTSVMNKLSVLFPPSLKEFLLKQLSTTTKKETKYKIFVHHNIIIPENGN